MVTRKVTFTLDHDTLQHLEDDATHVKKPKSAVVREALADYHRRNGRMSDEERREWLRSFDELIPTVRRRRPAEVRRELAAIRAERRTGGRRHPAE